MSEATKLRRISTKHNLVEGIPMDNATLIQCICYGQCVESGIL